MIMTPIAFDLGLATLTAQDTGPSAQTVQWSMINAKASVPTGLPVDAAHCIMATLSAEPLSSHLQLELVLRAKTQPARFDTAHGQWLHATEGRVGTATIALGTADAEWLGLHGQMPAAMLATDVADGAVTLSITLPQAVVAKGRQLKFAIAWVNDWAGNADLEVAPWLALGPLLNLPEVPDARG